MRRRICRRSVGAGAGVGRGDISSAAMPAAAESGLALNVPWCGIFSRPRRGGGREVEPVEHVVAPGHRPARQAASQDLRRARQVRRDAEMAWAPPGETRKPVTTSSKIRSTPPGGRSARAARQKSRAIGGHAERAAGRLDDRGGDVVIGLQQARASPSASFCSASSRPLCATRPARPGSGCRRSGSRNPRSCGRASRGSGAGSADNLDLPVKARASRTAIIVASVPEEVNRTRSADRDQLHDRFRPGDLGFVAGAVMGAALDLPLHRFDHLRVAMAQQQCPVAAEVVDVAIAVDVPLPRPLGPVM